MMSIYNRNKDVLRPLPKWLSFCAIVLSFSLGAFSCADVDGKGAPVAESESVMHRDACVVTRVVDGDTVVATVVGHGEVKIRLVGIDAPEMAQPYGDKAAEFLRERSLNKAGEVELVGEDKYGRLLGTLHVDGVNVCAELIGRGLAWHYVAYSSDTALAMAELKARG
jgi:micrococcal nuclease